MKISKFRIAVLVLLVVTIIYAFAYVQEANRYYSLVPFDYWPEFNSHREPFLTSFHGFVFLVVGVILFTAWVTTFLWKYGRCRKKSLW